MEAPMHARLNDEPALKPLSGQELQNKVKELQEVLRVVRNRLSDYRDATKTELIQQEAGRCDPQRNR